MTRRTAELPEVYLTPQEVADMLHVPVRTVMAWRNNTSVPLRGSKLGKHVRFTASEVAAFVESQRDDAA